MRPFASTLALGLVLAGIGACGPAMAQNVSRIEARLQAAVNKIQDACGADIKQYCSTVTPGEGRVLLCIEAHEDKISSKCDYALFDASRKLERALDRVEMAADACWADIQKSCADVPPGGGNILQCLASNKATVSKRCQAVVSKIQASK
jgi:hypothetical protein